MYYIIIIVTTKINVVVFPAHIHTANCGPPSPPPSGYIFPYTSTIDGAIVNFVCQKSAWNLKENLTVTVCNKQGKWDPNPAEFCAIVSGNNNAIIFRMS